MPVVGIQCIATGAKMGVMEQDVQSDEREWAQQDHHYLVDRHGADFPELLKQIPDPFEHRRHIEDTRKDHDHRGEDPRRRTRISISDYEGRHWQKCSCVGAFY